MQIIVVENQEKGTQKTKELLYEKVDQKTVLFLCGGSTPKALYKLFAEEKVIRPAAVGMVDERYGKKWHETSNELMMKDVGLLDYLASRDVPFYPILDGKQNREEAAISYDQLTRDLFFKFRKSVGVVGVGPDGHISSIAPNRPDFTNPLFSEDRKQLFVDEFNDITGKFGERVGMTFTGLHLIDILIVPLFGKDKENALHQIFESGSMEEIPARFFQQEASEKTIIITDLKI